MVSKLLPTLDLSEACEVNLDQAAVEWFQEFGGGAENPLLQPENTQKMIDLLHARRAVTW